MDSSESKSLSLNLDLPDLFARLSHSPMPVSNFTSTQQIFRDSDLKLSTEYTSQTYNEMSHFLSMADARSEVTNSKKNSNIFRTMINAIGSFANAVSKLPNYMMNINNPLSVTVVPNGGIISSEYILKNLTRKKEHLSSTCIDSSTNILECVKNKAHQKKLSTTKLEFSGMQHMNSTMNETLFGVCSKLPKTWMESVVDTNDDLEEINLPNLMCDSQTAILESIKLIHNTEHCSKIDNMPNQTKINRNIGKLNSSLCPKINMSEKTTENIPQINDNSFDGAETSAQCDELLNNKESIKKSFQKTKKCHAISRARSIGRGRAQLRKSGISQLKHRKNNSKHNIYSNIQDDMYDWERDQENFSEISSEDCISSTSPSTVDDNFNHDKGIDKFQITSSDYPALMCTSPESNQPKSIKIMEKKILESPLQSPKHDMSVNSQSRHPYDISNDSEDSCSIVFQDESGSECSTSYDSESSCSESESDESDDDPDHKVRFTSKPTIHRMIKWDFAYRAARIGPWEQAARDRERFCTRINCVGKILDPILLASHRERVYQNLFMEIIDSD